MVGPQSTHSLLPGPVGRGGRCRMGKAILWRCKSAVLRRVEWPGTIGNREEIGDDLPIVPERLGFRGKAHRLRPRRRPPIGMAHGVANAPVVRLSGGRCERDDVDVERYKGRIHDLSEGGIGRDLPGCVQILPVPRILPPESERARRKGRAVRGCVWARRGQRRGAESGRSRPRAAHVVEAGAHAPVVLTAGRREKRVLILDQQRIERWTLRHLHVVACCPRHRAVVQLHLEPA